MSWSPSCLQSFEEPEFDLAVRAGLPSRQEIVEMLMRIINQSTSYPGDKGTFTVREGWGVREVWSVREV